MDYGDGKKLSRCVLLTKEGRNVPEAISKGEEMFVARRFGSLQWDLMDLVSRIASEVFSSHDPWLPPPPPPPSPHGIFWKG